MALRTGGASLRCMTGLIWPVLMIHRYFFLPPSTLPSDFPVLETLSFFEIFPVLGTLRFYENFPVLETLRFYENFLVCGLCGGEFECEDIFPCVWGLHWWTLSVKTSFPVSGPCTGGL